MRSMNLRMIVALAALSLAAPLAGCKRAGATTEKAQPTPAAEAAQAAQAVPARFAKITERKLPPTFEASGSLVADETSEVAAPGMGVVEKVEVDVGSRVKKGDVLVRLDGRDASLRLAQANAAARQASSRLGLKKGEAFDAKNTAEVRAATEAMDLAVADAERTKTVFEAGGVPQATWDQAKARAEQARAQYEAALNGTESAWAALAAAQAQAGLAQKAASDTLIRAPFDGAVAERRITAGEFAPMGRVVAVVVRDQTLRLKLDIPEADVSKIEVGKTVSISVAAHPGRVFQGVIKRVGASVKAQSRSLPVEAEISNDDFALKPGFFARAEIALGGDPQPALLVPRAAIGTTGTATRVFVRAGNRVVERIVTVGREVEGLVEIRGMIHAGDEVAVENVEKLSDGAEIQAAP
ncbi:MAG: efflux RND transporter periplasmic adaptor subunit [Polyangiaceae bacterium]|nr:efflux RND transporter periplasmic adaptor subunit [Polyangiaceae bacterium]